MIKQPLIKTINANINDVQYIIGIDHTPGVINFAKYDSDYVVIHDSVISNRTIQSMRTNTINAINNGIGKFYVSKLCLSSIIDILLEHRDLINDVLLINCYIGESFYSDITGVFPDTKDVVFDKFIGLNNSVRVSYDRNRVVIDKRDGSSFYIVIGDNGMVMMQLSSYTHHYSYYSLYHDRDVISMIMDKLEVFNKPTIKATIIKPVSSIDIIVKVDNENPLLEK